MHVAQGHRTTQVFRDPIEAVFGVSNADSLSLLVSACRQDRTAHCYLTA